MPTTAFIKWTCMVAQYSHKKNRLNYHKTLRYTSCFNKKRKKKLNEIEKMLFLCLFSNYLYFNVIKNEKLLLKKIKRKLIEEK